MTEHPITPPRELAELSSTQLSQIFDGLDHCFSKQSKRDYLSRWISDWTAHKIIRAAQWSADIELEACCALLELYDDNARKYLQSARRPKPPSLKEQALQALAEADLGSTEADWYQRFDTIRRALEQLPDNN